MTIDFNHNVRVCLSVEPSTIGQLSGLIRFGAEKLGEVIVSKLTQPIRDIEAKIESEGREIREAVTSAFTVALKAATDPLMAEIEDLKTQLANSGASDEDIAALNSLSAKIDGLSDTVAGAVTPPPVDPEIPTEPTGEFPAPAEPVEPII